MRNLTGFVSKIAGRLSLDIQSGKNCVKMLAAQYNGTAIPLDGYGQDSRFKVIFHTDQGSVYASRAFCQAYEHDNLFRPMSREGTPTDNPIIEALNG